MQEIAIVATRRWLESAVLGLNLCPFARVPHREGRIRICASAATDVDALLSDLQQELERLAEAPTSQLETTLLVLTGMLSDFLDFNDFLEAADALLQALDLDGVLQIAPFHPQFQFGDAPADDVANATNRSPWPTLHLLREDSIEAAVASVNDPDAIYERNIARLRELGEAGWAELSLGWQTPAASDEAI